MSTEVPPGFNRHYNGAWHAIRIAIVQLIFADVQVMHFYEDCITRTVCRGGQDVGQFAHRHSHTERHGHGTVRSLGSTQAAAKDKPTDCLSLPGSTYMP